jgi:glycine/D-amino acid oxidase-like deaminating enzyme
VTQPDFVVIGGGIVGCGCSVERAKRGARVALIEKDDIGFEQSGRSTAAVALPDGQEPASDAVSTLPLKAAQTWDRFEGDWDCSIEINRDGWLSIAVDDADRAWWDRDLAKWRESFSGSQASVRLSAPEARSRYPLLAGDFIGLDIRNGGHVNPMLVMRSLKRALQRLGVEVRNDTTVTGFELRQRSREIVDAVLCGDRRIPCGGVVIAAGVWSSRLSKLLGLRVPLQRLRVPINETGPIASSVIPGFLRCGTFGARQNGNGTIRLTGGYRRAGVIHDLTFDDLTDLPVWAPALVRQRKDFSRGFDPGLLKYEIRKLTGRGRWVPVDHEPKANRRLGLKRLSSLKRLVPSLADVHIHRSFAGITDLTPDGEPAIGRVPNVRNAFVGFGFSGHGYLLGPAAATALARLSFTGDSQPELMRYDPQRFSHKGVRMSEQMF